MAGGHALVFVVVHASCRDAPADEAVRPPGVQPEARDDVRRAFGNGDRAAAGHDGDNVRAHHRDRGLVGHGIDATLRDARGDREARSNDGDSREPPGRSCSNESCECVSHCLRSASLRLLVGGDAERGDLTNQRTRQ